MRQSRPICLASSSPRRRELLERFGLHFEQFAPSVEEKREPGESPDSFVERMAARKADAAIADFPGHLVLAADTVVLHGDSLLGKPATAKDAESMLTRLSGRTHQVLTGYHLLDGATGDRLGRVISTRVTFRVLPKNWIRWYSQLDESTDKAGAYGIQGIGGAMILKIDGSYNNVVGLPIEEIIWDLLDRRWISL